MCDTCGISSSRDFILISDAGFAIYKIYFKQQEKSKPIDTALQGLRLEWTRPPGALDTCHHLRHWGEELVLQAKPWFQPRRGHHQVSAQASESVTGSGSLLMRCTQ